MHENVIAIVGPTATGKSSLAIQLARKFGGEIVSADSRQVYQGLDIGTGKVTRAEQRLVPHYLLDVARPSKVFSVADFIPRAQLALERIARNSHIPIVTGGTGFWIDTLLRGESIPNIPPNQVLRKKLQKLAPAQLFRRLQKADPQRAKAIDQHNPVRLIRALEILATTGKPIPKRKTSIPYNVLWLGVDFPDRVLKQRIHVRLVKRFRQGMIAEVRLQLKRGVPAKRFMEMGLEYRYITQYLKGEMTRTELSVLLERAIWHYAKRQRTWFKRNSNIHWVKNEKQALRLANAFLKT